MKVLVTTIGSSGDVYPFLSVARALRARGHEVLMLVNRCFQVEVSAAGFRCEGVGPAFELADIADKPDMMHPRRGTTVIFREFVLPSVAPMLNAVEAAITNFSPDVALSHATSFPTRWVCQRRGIPCAQAVLSPMVWFSRYEPVILRPWEPRFQPRVYFRLRNVLAKWASRRIIDRPMNEIRRRCGFPDLRDHLFGALRAGDINLALWSPVFRPPMPDDPPRSRICGFAWNDSPNDTVAATPALDRFLADGPPPIIFTLGSTAVHVADDFYQHAADACHLLGRRGVLLTGRTDNASLRLSDDVVAVPYVEHARVLPQGCASVVHGGVGTTGQALRAGKPVVVVPFAHDQFDNAARARRMGVSVTVSRSRVQPHRLAKELKRLLDNPEVVRRAEQVGLDMAAENGADTAARALEEWVSGE